MAIENQTEEQKLVAACLSGQTKAQQQFYQRFAPVLFPICKRYASDEDFAKDMFQESMIKVFHNLGEFRFAGSLEGWVKRICVNQCLDALKRAKSRFADSLELAYDIEAPENLASNYNAIELLQLLQKLPVGYRTVFNLYAIEGYSHAEIAELLEITENTSKSQLFKARKWLQNALTK